jgi:membrane protein implicated in regulation of membrane protease activity
VLVPVTDLLAELWDQQSVWSQTADRMKQRISRARAVALGVAIAIAVLGTLSGVLAGAQPTLARVVAGLAAGGALVLPVLRPRWSGPVLRDWTRARSVSEALKSEVYLRLARAGDYRDDPDGVLLRKKTGKVRGDGADLLRYQAGITPRQRELPAVHDVGSYFAVRVTGQIDTYYRRKARQMQTRLGWFRVVETGLAVLGAVLGGIAAAVGGSSWAPWIAVVTTISTAVAVHVAATRYEYQVIEFLRTADRLEQLKSTALTGGTADELDALAMSAEDVISIENQAWMAKLAEDPADHTTTTGDHS